MSPMDQLYKAFKAHLRHNYETGITCQGHSKNFVPYSVLQKYWTHSRIKQLLKAVRIKELTPTNVQDGFLLVISILCFNCNIELLPTLVSESLDDGHLPWKDIPGRVQDESNINQLRHFFDSQWIFCPRLIFGLAGDLNLHRDTILAFKATESTVQGQGRERNVYIREVLQGAHSHLDHPIPKYVVVKSFPPHLHQEYFNERVSYNAFTHGTSNITQLMGSYSWLSEQNQRTGNLILEYAEHGSLLDFFEQKSPPYKPDEISSLWAGIAGIAKGVECIHASTGLHLDLKPGNVVVLSGADPLKKFSFIFKMIDFEHSYVAPQDSGLNGSKPARTNDQRTSKTYAPPELVLGDEINYHVGPEADLWPLGCIILECAVWISLGERGRLDFIEGRMAETDPLSDYEKSGRRDCFHDGREILRCVHDFGQQIKDHGRRDDEITSKMFDLAIKELLVEKDKRQSAGRVYSAMKKIIDTEADRRRTSLSTPTNGALTGQHSLITGKPVIASPTSEQEHVLSYTSHIVLEGRSPVSESNLEMLTAEPRLSRKESPTIGTVIKWIEKKKVDGDTPELEGWESVQAQLNGRDFIFVIDNSETMQEHEDQVKSFVHSLAYLVKRLDPDGAEIMCTSDPMTRSKFKHATGHSKFVTKNFSRGRGGPCNMEFVLEQALDPIGEQLQSSASKSNIRRTSLLSLPGILIGRKKPVTVIVFTDGNWGSSTGGGAENPIQGVISKMRDYGVSRSTVAIQFLRFGSNPVGERRLKFLDDDLAKKDRNSGFDIVDTQPVTGSIWDILIGPVDEHVDGTAVHSPSQ
ncbi:unnamed protein product [Clonostachys byssicola]|uniref:Protein kinase domain-containing protein n=1 Tax=Clonostachys byssicola TaxID=160290 RepID=A0A9N9URI8_9HYPO|nr:unnamed protein product [Clonostachys byssicola]